MKPVLLSLAALLFAGTAAFAQEPAPAATPAPPAATAPAPEAAPATPAPAAPPAASVPSAPSEPVPAREPQVPNPAPATPDASADPSGADPFGLIPDLPAGGKRPAGGEIGKRLKSSPTEEATNELQNRLRFRTAKTRAVQDPAIQAEWDRAQSAASDREKREVLRSYYSKLYARMLKIDPKLKVQLADAERAVTSRLQQRFVPNEKSSKHSKGKKGEKESESDPELEDEITPMDDGWGR